MQQLIDQAKSVLRNNWKEEFTIPCEGLYPFQWFWDSGFIAIGWAHIDMERAKQEIRSLLKGQWENGFIPHIVFHNDSDTYFPGPEVHAANLSPFSPLVKTSGITQPPVLGFVLEELLNISDQDPAILEFIDSVYDQVFQNHHYFYSNRDPKNEGLVYICHNWEAGTDNTPIWDRIWDTFDVPDYDLKRRDTQLIDASHRPTNKEYQYYIHLIELFKSWNYNDELIAEKSPFLVQDPLFNSMLIRSNESLIVLGKHLNRQTQIEQLQQWQLRAKSNFNSKLFNSELNSYVYYDLRNERYLNCISSSSFTPLFAGIPNDDQAKALVAHMSNGRFDGHNERFLCASFDPTSSDYNSQKYWRGPIWINLNWLIYKGLKRYGFHSVADRVKSDSIELLGKYGFYEYFEPSITLNKSLSKGYGGKNFSWSAALFLDLINENKH